ncbi:hypothetical protein ACFQ3K_14760 [Brucella gallinifaecis]|uniref:Uncharacterized protein n=1 Tax=Brucella gallinifaecis TaxID=215590 RepID=A0A502BR84_9HYPH|nr:hypothetical protein [Brucella gallinifaecis]TPF76724.1 hypothetical protein FHY56_04315 [Brucella gallinifaecis]
MAGVKPSEAQIVVKHHEDGRMLVFINGQIIPGLECAQITQDCGRAALLSLSFNGRGFRLDTSPLTVNEWRETRKGETA